MSSNNYINFSLHEDNKTNKNNDSSDNAYKSMSVRSGVNNSSAKNNNNKQKNAKAIRILCIVFVAMFSAVFLFACVNETNAQSYMRIHIRAHSNSEADQDVKFLVKDNIVNYLTPLVASVASVDELKQVLESNLSVIENVAVNTLSQKGFSYGANVSLNNELFPTRYYDGVILPTDYYDAIVVNLGSGSGDNWWCVVYPPLCFIGEENTGANGIVYKSKLVEIVNKFFK